MFMIAKVSRAWHGFGAQGAESQKGCDYESHKGL